VIVNGKQHAVTNAAASLSDGLYKKLEAQILSGELQPGARLPSQKDVAETENVSRTVVREAVARLAAQGLITSRQGSGVYVAETAQYKPFQVTRDELAELADIIKLLEMRPRWKPRWRAWPPRGAPLPTSGPFAPHCSTWKTRSTTPRPPPAPTAPFTWPSPARRKTIIMKG
jgi:DNA-binding transcriptional regulator YhcF (GntR family)